ncbi:FAD-dependent oxidoreductase [Rhodococcus fascians]|nr:FAD-dependent oxidoreductase [Rhodococcus fascians]MBY3825373.1 FAD-dependent oxidoreductase [Rhodococcus fascians]MBY3835834.1 FAD-dependent oxidoreductase [Rhodococcus fascians]MBY3865046.1 FAD-dependent oxidoreductase [Rhodococcus fascians]MBY3884552.1 FAD-dependent oxidoreductase [Rhodococcus fascians]
MGIRRSSSSVPESRADVVVVGGGTAGIVAAKTAAGFGVRVVLIERDRTGGDCLWTGCVPSKALLAAASVAQTVRSASRFGIDTEPPRVDFARVMQHVHGSIAEIAPIDSPEALTAAGVDVISGDAVFTGPNTVNVGTRMLHFGQAIVTTGAHPTVPAIDGIDSVDYLTSDTLWDLTTLPERLLIVGAGSVGCEMAQAFSRLGSDVTLVGRSATILPREHPEASSILTQALTDEGVRVLTSTAVVRIENGSAVTDAGVEIQFDRVLIATGRTPRTASLGLGTAGVEVGDSGFVHVDANLRTTNPRIWAAGDLTGHPQFTHTAGVHGSLAASNAVLGLRRKVSTTGTPRVTFTDPEIASAGIDVRTAHSRGLRLQTLDHHHVDRAVTEEATNGSTTLVLDAKRRIVGACVVGPRAGETIGELIIAIEQGLRTGDLAGTTHPYPTYNDGPWNAAIADVKAQLGSPVVSRATGALAQARGTWIRRARDTQR